MTNALTSFFKNAKKEFMTGYRLGDMQRQVKDGTVDTWVTEVTRHLIPHTIIPNSEHQAYIEDDKSMLYIRLNEEDLTQLAQANTHTLKQAIQAIVAHEMGHVVDGRLAHLQQQIHQAMANDDKDTLTRLVLERENRAWTLGREFAIDSSMYEGLNRANIRLYKEQLS